jgi:hypothetical protein
MKGAWVSGKRHRFTPQIAVTMALVPWDTPKPARSVRTPFRRQKPDNASLKPQALSSPTNILWLIRIWRLFVTTFAKRSRHANECHSLKNFGQTNTCPYISNRMTDDKFVFEAF